MDRLTSMCYPQYINEGENGYGTRDETTYEIKDAENCMVKQTKN